MVAPVQENLPIPGSAVVRLTNATNQENAYTIRLRCDQPQRMRQIPREDRNHSA